MEEMSKHFLYFHDCTKSRLAEEKISDYLSSSSNADLHGRNGITTELCLKIEEAESSSTEGSSPQCNVKTKGKCGHSKGTRRKCGSKNTHTCSCCSKEFSSKCSKKFTQVATLKRDQIMVHSNKMYFLDCTKSWVPEEISDHLSSYSNAVSHGRDGITTELYLKIEEEESSSAEVSSPQCNEKTKKKHGRSKGTKRKCGSMNTHTCSSCNKEFSSKCDLERHVSVHTNDKRYKCKVCPKEFSQQRNLQSHVHTVHTISVPVYTCSVCNKEYARKSSLAAHMTLHTGKKLYKCSVCSKEFNWKGRLKEHTRLHYDENAYICNLCRKKFTRGAGLKKHLWCVHGVFK